MPESTALALSGSRPPRPPRELAKPNKQDRSRWFLFHKHVPIEEIAKRCNVSIIAVQKSIDKMEAYKAQTSNEIVDMRRNEMAINLADKAEAALGRALGAQTVVRRENKRGKLVVVSRDPDHKTQIEAARVTKELMEAVIPKGGGVNIAVAATASAAAETARRSNFEDRLRTIRERRGLTNTANVVEAEYEDVDETAEEYEDQEEPEEGDGESQ